ncbi:type VII secretion integral membrane protein EccD [Mycolicibacterium goodii]|uniref:type VII secretion integral membrane protein EccD n=1 Tax=Mycolicibacterium goodii TaxID=134601 RepID=UPI001BDC6A33|nr:type VII secretion integral membrane protein EccD [Mycolicibacterium goodii]MBU8819269.1 type VII secretion integral membrane protein EccD [Mycolicibacterium goodii]
MTLLDGADTTAEGVDASGAATPGQVREKPEQVRPKSRVRLAEQVRVAVIFAGRQHDMVLPATLPAGAVADGVLKNVVEGSLLEPDEAGYINPGTVTFTRIGGTALDRSQTLLQQSVFDGDLLVLDVADAEVSLTPVVESASSAVAQHLSTRRRQVDVLTATRFAAITAAAGVVIAVGFLLNAWRINLSGGQYWNTWPALATAILTFALLGIGTIVWARHHLWSVATALWLSSLVAAPAAAVMATPGPPQAWHAVFGLSTLAVLAAVLWGSTPAPRGVLAWVTLTSFAGAVMAVLVAVGVRWSYVWVIAMAIALWVLKKSESLAGIFAKLPMPEFPTVTGKNVFGAADDIAAEAIEAAAVNGTPSMEELHRKADAANAYLTAIVASVAVFFLGGAIFTITPYHGRWWLSTVYVLGVATILVLAGRALADRVQAMILVGTALTMAVIVAATYVRAEPTAVMSLAMAGAVLALGVASLLVVAVVPRRVFSPLFRKLVEWLEYVLIAAGIPVCLWLCNVYEWARNWSSS